MDMKCGFHYIQSEEDDMVEPDLQHACDNSLVCVCDRDRHR